MAAPRVFIGHTILLPGRWLAACESPRHVQQGNLLVTCNSKADVERALLAVGCGVREAENLRQQVRLAYSRQWSTEVTAMIEAGIAEPGSGQVIVWRDVGSPGPLIVEVGPRETYTVVGTRRYDSDLRRTVYRKAER